MKLATRKYIESEAPDGLYRVWDEPTRFVRAFDPYTGETVTGPGHFVARVRERGELPMGVEEIVIRPDGHQVIYCLSTGCGN
jgi:hypothetical protein